MWNFERFFPYFTEQNATSERFISTSVHGESVFRVFLGPRGGGGGKYFLRGFPRCVTVSFLYGVYLIFQKFELLAPFWRRSGPILGFGRRDQFAKTSEKSNEPEKVKIGSVESPCPGGKLEKEKQRSIQGEKIVFLYPGDFSTATCETKILKIGSAVKFAAY